MNHSRPFKKENFDRFFTPGAVIWSWREPPIPVISNSLLKNRPFPSKNRQRTSWFFGRCFDYFHVFENLQLCTKISALQTFEIRQVSGYIAGIITGGYLSRILRTTQHWLVRILKGAVLRMSAGKHLKWGCSGIMKGPIKDLKWGCSGNEGPQSRSQMELFWKLGPPVRTSHGAGSGNEGPH